MPVILTGLTALTAALLVVYRAKSPLSRIRGKYFDSAGVRIHYTDQGQGEPVILLHGFVMHADLNWRRYGIIDKLAKQYRVIAVDLRGHGLSGKPHDAEAYGVAMVEDVRRLLDHLGLERAHLVGFSTGGFITLKFLTLYPDRVLTAVASGMAHRAIDAETKGKLERIGAALEERGDFRPLMEELDLPSRGILATLRMAVIKHINDTVALSHVIRSFPEFEVEAEALARNTVPTLTLVGTLDPIAAGAEEMHALMGNHTLVWLKGGDKLSCLVMPEFLGAVLRHLEESTRAAGAVKAGA